MEDASPPGWNGEGSSGGGGGQQALVAPIQPKRGPARTLLTPSSPSSSSPSSYSSCE